MSSEAAWRRRRCCSSVSDSATGEQATWLRPSICVVPTSDEDFHRQNGVPCELEIVPGAFHSFDLLAPKAGLSRQFFASQCSALCGALNGGH